MAVEEARGLRHSTRILAHVLWIWLPASVLFVSFALVRAARVKKKEEKPMNSASEDFKNANVEGADETNGESLV